MSSDPNQVDPPVSPEDAGSTVPPKDGQSPLSGKLGKWILGAVIVALLGFPIVQRIRSGPANSGGGVSETDADVQRSVDLYNAGKYQESITAAQAAIKLNPNAVLAYNNIAVDYLQLKNYDEALKNIKQALAVQPDLALAQTNLKWILGEQAKANGVAPAPPDQNPDYLIGVSQQKYNAKQFQECIDAANQALKLQPGMAEAYNNIAVCNIELGKYDVAIENARLALRSKPDYQLAKGNLKWAQMKKTDASRGSK